MVRPYAAPSEGFDDIYVSVRISMPDGTWLDISDGRVFDIADGSFTGTSTQMRRLTLPSAFLEGEEVGQALRQNKTEQLNVWVKGPSSFELGQSIDLLTSAVEQTRFQVERVIDTDLVLWNCYASDHVVESDRPLMFARMAQVKISLLRHPAQFRGEDVS